MFKDILKEMVEGVEGGMGAVLMDFDGIAVEQHSASDSQYAIETVGMEFSMVLKEVRKATELLRAGATEELAVRSDKIDTVFRVINDSYFVALALAPGSAIGKGRFLLRLAAPRIRAEL